LPPSPAPLPASSPTAANTPAPPAPIGRVGLGAYLDGTPYDSFAATARFEKLVSQKMRFTLWFQAWGDDDRAFPTHWIQLASQQGLTPVITWEPWRRDFANPITIQPAYALERIAAGDHDAYIRDWARRAAALGIPFILRFAHEQSTEPGVRSWYPWQGNPEQYRNAFRHIVAIFRQEGADDVQFLWSAMWLNEWAGRYYPGPDAVDYVGATVLNHGTAPGGEWAKWRTFDDLFGVQHEAALAWDKPIILTELASAEQGGDKAAWLSDCFTSIRTRYPLVQGVLLFEVASDREWPAINWSVASTSRSLEAFRQTIHDPYFQ
jgi:hypothetical protein